MEDPESLRQHKGVVAAATIWLIGRLIISLFVPIVLSALFLASLAFYIVGLSITVFSVQIKLTSASFRSDLLKSNFPRVRRRAPAKAEHDFLLATAGGVSPHSPFQGFAG